MNKIACYLLGIMVLVIASCSREDVVNNPVNPPVVVDAGDVHPSHFYGIAYPENITRGIAQRDRLWYPGSTIKVRFLNDPYNKADHVKTYAAEWEEYAGIRFEFIQSGNAHVRIGFDWNDERYITWSYIGTDCKMVTNQNEATMSFAYWDSSTEQDIKADVLRAFGQVLGLELEHRHLEFDPGWTNRIASYWEGEIEDIPWEDLEQYVLTPLEEREILQTAEYDDESIMIWPFSSRYARNTARSFNYELSEKDKEFIGQVYPKEEDNYIVKGTNCENNLFAIDLRLNSTLVVDWGDGVIDNINYQEYTHLEHNYYADINTFKIYGATNSIISFSCKSTDLSSLDVSRSTGLTSLGCSYNKLTELKLEKNSQLLSLSCTGNLLDDLCLSNNLELETLYCDQNKLSLLNVTNNTKLKTLGCSYNRLETIDLSNNPELSGFSCSNNQLQTIDISNNPNLFSFECSYNPLQSLDISNNDKLYILECNGIPLNTIDISHNNNLGILYCKENIFQSLDFTNNPMLRELYCEDGQLISLDFSNNPKFQILNCDNNQIQSLDFSNQPIMMQISCKNNPILQNQAALIQLAESLPDRSSMWRGELTVGDSTAKEWIREICAAKNWIIN